MANCPNVLLQGACSDLSCQHNHNILSCEVCDRIFPTKEVYEGHLTSQTHRNRAAGVSTVYRCPLCNINITGDNTWHLHIAGKKHTKVARRQGVPPEVTSVTPLGTGLSKFCELCRTLVPLRQWDAHVLGRKHKSRETFTKYASAVQEAESDKNGVVVEGEFDFGFIDPHEEIHGAKKTATVSTTVPKCRCLLMELRLASSQGQRRVASAYVCDPELDL